MTPRASRGQDAGFGRALPGLLVSGVLLSVVGAMLPVWGHYLRSDFSVIGNYFLFLVFGMLANLWFARKLIGQRGIQAAFLVGCSAAVAGLVFLALAAPPAPDWWRTLGCFVLGSAAAYVNSAVFFAGTERLHGDAAPALTLAGAYFGAGALCATFLIAGTFESNSPVRVLYVVALVPAIIAVHFRRTSLPATVPEQQKWTEVVPQFTNPSAVLFSLLLFFQFGNEWAIAGWLPMFLIQRLGMSPQLALMLLALYWFMLLGGRVAATWWLPRVSAWRALMGSGAGALLGCLMLALTNNGFGATLGTAILGLSFAVIYPLVADRIGARFPSYHPGVFNGVFSFALTGGILAPAHLGYLADWLGIGIVMLLPVLGTSMVLLLTVLIWVEVRFGSAQTHDDRL